MLLEIMMPQKKLISAYKGGKTDTPPVWLMRQAGRYLPEYRQIREKAGSFLDMVYDPATASEITMQPVRRFGMDGAILFSDILVIPHALGQEVRFEPGRGPVLDAIANSDDIARLEVDAVPANVSPVAGTVREVRAMLRREGYESCAMIGFAGAPWTVAAYMIEGQGSRDFLKAKEWAYSNPAGFAQLIDKVVASTIIYLKSQIEAGAEAIKLFDSWAGLADRYIREHYIIKPARDIVAALKSAYPDIPVIAFPKNIGACLPDYVDRTGIDAIAIDPQTDTGWAAQHLQPRLCVQGNLDPACLRSGGGIMEAETRRIIDDLSSGPFVFNLGHGVIKDTPPAHVDHVVKIIRGYQP